MGKEQWTRDHRVRNCHEKNDQGCTLWSQLMTVQSQSVVGYDAKPGVAFPCWEPSTCPMPLKNEVGSCVCTHMLYLKGLGTWKTSACLPFFVPHICSHQLLPYTLNRCPPLFPALALEVTKFFLTSSLSVLWLILYLLPEQWFQKAGGYASSPLSILLLLLPSGGKPEALQHGRLGVCLPTCLVLATPKWA